MQKTLVGIPCPSRCAPHEVRYDLGLHYVGLDYDTLTALITMGTKWRTADSLLRCARLEREACGYDRPFYLTAEKKRKSI